MSRAYGASWIFHLVFSLEVMYLYPYYQYCASATGTLSKVII